MYSVTFSAANSRVKVKKKKTFLMLFMHNDWL